MYLNCKSIVHIHFLGEKLYLFDENEKFIILNDVESIVMQECFFTNQIQKLICNINKKYNIDDKNIVANMLDNVIDTLSDYIYRTENEINNFKKISISGEINKNYPKNVTISLTNNCPQNCIHCFKGNINKIKYINNKEVKELLNCLESKTEIVQFTGGEPFLHPDFCSLLDDFSDKFKITITTSGYYLNEEILKKLNKATFVQISLYSHISEDHNNFTGVTNSFKTVINNIKLMIENGVNLGVSTLLHPQNYKDIEKYIEFCISLRIANIKFGTIMKIGKAINLKNFFLSNDQLKECTLFINILKDKYKEQIYIDFWDTDENNLEFSSVDSKFCCGAGKLHWSIDEHGNIFPCGILACNELIMGNIHNKDYVKIINNELYHNIKWEDIEYIKLDTDNIRISDLCTSHL